MLPSFVITLREGVEAALIVGIVAAFLHKQERDDALRWMWAGVALAAALCLAVGVALEVVGGKLPQRGQEGLETVVGLVAVGMVTYMIIWMKRHSRGLKASLEGDAAAALAAGSTIALVGMAFLAVLREGFETSVFLVAVFQGATDRAAAITGAILGLVVALGIGYAFYRGGVRINLSRFFRVTGLVLVLVAAGLVATSVHTAHEAGWFNGMQGQALDLAWLVVPGSWTAALLTGILGLQPSPTVGEVAAWLLYAVPMAAFVLWPAGRSRRAVAVPAAGAVLAGVAIAATALAAGCGSSAKSSEAFASVGSSRVAKVKLTDKGCSPANFKLTAGPITFAVTGGSASVSELEVLKGDQILGEVEQLAPGLTNSFSLTLVRGNYITYCPNGTDAERGKIIVTGESGGAVSSAEHAATAQYLAYVQRQTDLLVDRTKDFTDAVRAGNVARAKQLFPIARQPYESIEPVAESFGKLDPDIDARVNDVEPGQEWTGFHRIEKALWVDNSTAGMRPVADQLDRDVLKLQRKARTVKLEPAQIANGANELLAEVSKSKITGEEDRYSHTDLYDFKANVDGSRVAFQAIKALLSRSDPAVAQAIEERFTEVDRALDEHRRGEGFVSYNELTRADTRVLSQVIDSLAEPLSQGPLRVVKQ